MMNAKNCICRGQKIEVLLARFNARMVKRIAAGVVDGVPAPNQQDLRMTVTLIRALAEGREKGPFQARYARLDHHMHECPCSPSYVAPAGTP